MLNCVKALCLAVLCALLPMPAFAQSGTDVVTGNATVLDSDIIAIGPQRVILWGIDAPEKDQWCYRDGDRWGCHDAAFRTLEILTSRGTVTCYLTGEPDPFNRRYGVCEIGDEDINKEMVEAGMALAYTDQTDQYEQAQFEAIAAQKGLWQLGVEFQEPWEFRKQNHPGGYR